MGTPTITFLGATETVTGSRFLVATDSVRILVDAGLFQGTRDIRQRNWDPFPIEPETIDAVVLTHAHLDHCGYLPLLVKQGFNNRVFCTENTRLLVGVILRDSGRIQEEDAYFAARRGYSKHRNPQALYTEADAINALKLITDVAFHERQQIATDVFVTFYPSGHILGSAFVVLEVEGARLLFTGDMGRTQHPILVPPDPVPAEHFDAVITESTYGDRIHETPSDMFSQIITKTITRGGSVLIPAFAVDRTEVILIELRKLMQSGAIPRVPVYVDSPMALSSLAFYRDAIQSGDAEIRPDVIHEWKGDDIFDSGTLHEMRTVEESKSLNDVHGPHIIVSASGMATGGRVVHHLARMLPEARNTVLLVGFQAAGTRGRLLEQGDTEVKIHGEWVPVLAQIAKAESFSVHADGIELGQWLGKAQSPDAVFVVHGETGAAQTFASHLSDKYGWDVVVPTSAQEFTLGAGTVPQG